MRTISKSLAGTVSAGLLALGVATATTASAGPTSTTHYFGTQIMFALSHDTTIGNGLVGVNLDATDADGADSGTLQIANFASGNNYDATLTCVNQTTDLSGNDVVHVSGTIDGGVPATYVQMTVVGTPSDTASVDNVIKVGLNHRSTKPYKCTRAESTNHSVFGGQIVINDTPDA